MKRTRIVVWYIMWFDVAITIYNDVIEDMSESSGIIVVYSGKINQTFEHLLPNESLAAILPR